eukprot:CAMPEP_0202461358 /NCGR_PEP_ID=MMETSP1360-20130828/48993_1 /ASSEMBLY_ACC=CAM_ASM_000848 /TAXON_ID=515479 /ORGANISM="Licmophora paradoxa, Strain CCMP2313" /LENGTH=407 /DNA_ID=CAMNT_0049083355 /DNA_START=5 /DNA_END=1228 /DNA_ORIENTATION=-
MSVGKDDLYQNDAKFHAFPGSTYPPVSWDLGFSDMKRSASKTRCLKEVANYDLFRRHLENTFVTTSENKTFWGKAIYEDCFHGKMDQGSQCIAETFIDTLYPDDFVRDEALEILKAKPEDKPWYLQVNFPGPHPPIFVTSEMASSVHKRKWPDPADSVIAQHWSCPEYGGNPEFGGRCNYGAELERLDNLMKSIVDQVTLEDTMVCITGDHGEMLGDHNLGGKKVPWQPSISVPLLCMGAGIQVGKTYGDPVTTLDLPGTFMEVAGVEKAEKMTTQSLVPALTTPSQPLTRQTVHSGLDEWRAVIRSINGVSWKLVCCIGKCQSAPTGTPEPSKGWSLLLYDTEADPDDMISLHWENPNIVATLRQDLPRGWCPNTNGVTAKPPPLSASTGAPQQKVPITAEQKEAA